MAFKHQNEILFRECVREMELEGGGEGGK